jgi:hypothetical protein
MKPSPMPSRMKPLARTAELSRSTPLEGGGVLERRTRIRPVSKKRAAANRVRRAMAAGMFPERPLCVVYVLSQDHPGVIPDEVINGCGRWADDVHEPLTRARGGSITNPDNAVPPCRPCHDVLGGEPSWGYELGLLVHSWDGPRRAGAA